MTVEQKAWNTLKSLEGSVSKQRYRTFKGQLKAGDYTGALKGMNKVIRKDLKNDIC